MATPYAGRSGRLYVGIASGGTAEPIANLKSWSIDFSVDRYDVTCLGDVNKVQVAGLPDTSGDFAGFWDSASAQLHTAALDGVARKAYLYPSTSAPGIYWFGTANFDFHVEGAVDATVDIAGTWAAASAWAKVG